MFIHNRKDAILFRLDENCTVKQQKAVVFDGRRQNHTYI